MPRSHVLGWVFTNKIQRFSAAVSNWSSLSGKNPNEKGSDRPARARPSKTIHRDTLKANSKAQNLMFGKHGSLVDPSCFARMSFCQAMTSAWRSEVGAEF